MNTQQPPQWKRTPDAPGFWILQRENDLAALLGAKFAILEIKPASIERPPSSKYCVRAYGPIPTEEENTPATENAGQRKSNEQSIADLREITERHTRQIREIKHAIHEIDEDNREADNKILANTGAIARILLAIGDQEKTPSERLKTPLEKRIENFLDKNLPK